MTRFRREFGTLLQDYKKDNTPRIQRGESASAFDELRLWMREASDEDGLWAFERAPKAMRYRHEVFYLLIEPLSEASPRTTAVLAEGESVPGVAEPRIHGPEGRVGSPSGIRSGIRS